MGNLLSDDPGDILKFDFTTKVEFPACNFDNAEEEASEIQEIIIQFINISIDVSGAGKIVNLVEFVSRFIHLGLSNASSLESQKMDQIDQRIFKAELQRYKAELNVIRGALSRITNDNQSRQIDTVYLRAKYLFELFKDPEYYFWSFPLHTIKTLAIFTNIFHTLLTIYSRIDATFDSNKDRIEMTNLVKEYYKNFFEKRFSDLKIYRVIHPEHYDIGTIVDEAWIGKESRQRHSKRRHTPGEDYNGFLYNTSKDQQGLVDYYANGLRNVYCDHFRRIFPNFEINDTIYRDKLNHNFDVTNDMSF